MAKFSFNGNPLLSEEMFREAMSSDKGIFECATSGRYCDRFGHEIGRYVNYPSFEDVHDITPEQIAEAKLHFQRRHDEEIASLQKGVLAFVAMGGDFTSKLPNGVGNYRMRCDFKNSRGKQFFIEFCLAAREETFWIDFSIDRQLQKKYEKECQEQYEKNKNLPYRKQEHRLIPQYYYNAKNVEKQMKIEVIATWPEVIKFINKTYGCKYTSAKLFRYFVSPDDYVCFC